MGTRRIDCRSTLTSLLFIVFALSQIDTLPAGETIETESVLLRIVDRVAVPARVSGTLLAIRVVEGQAVDRGAHVAQLDDADAELLRSRAQVELDLAAMKADNDVGVRSANAALEFARSRLKQLQEAATAIKGSVSQSELEKAKAEAVQAEFDLENARHSFALARLTKQLKECDFRLGERNVQLRIIEAPLTGLVTQIFKRPGEWVEAGDQVMQIVSMDRLRAEGFVPAKDVPEDLPGAAVTLQVNLANRRSKSFSGKIVFVHPEIDPVNGQMRVWAEIQNREGWLRPGMRATMSIEVPGNSSSHGPETP